MITELKIKLTSKDCKEITQDLKKFIKNKSGLNPKTYHLYNKIKFFVTAYEDIEKED